MFVHIHIYLFLYTFLYIVIFTYFFFVSYTSIFVNVSVRCSFVDIYTFFTCSFTIHFSFGDFSWKFSKMNDRFEISTFEIEYLQNFVIIRKLILFGAK